MTHKQYYYILFRYLSTGEPAYDMMETHPDWAPSLHLGHTELKATDSSRHARQRERLLKKRKVLVESEEMEEVMSDAGEGVGTESDSLFFDGNDRTVSQSVQTDKSDITSGRNRFDERRT